MMKKIINGLSAFLVPAVFALAGCDADHTTYDGPSYIMFSDTLSVLPVQDNDEYTDIPIAATQACDYDRTVGVEVIEKESNAIEGRHYELVSNTVTIKAGERVGNLKVRGFYSNVAVGDSLGFALRLIEKPEEKWSLYSDVTKVVLQKVCPFDIHAFTGYAVLQSSFLSEFTNDTQRLIRTEMDPSEENTVVLKDCFYEGYDMKIRFTTDDVLNPLIEMDDQKFSLTADAFGTIYGDDGIIRAYQPASVASYYSSCENFVLQYITLYVPNYPTGNDATVGTFYNIIKWISDDEAEALKLQGY